MKRTINNIILILFPLIFIPLFAFYTKNISLIVGVRKLYTPSIIFNIIFALVLGIYAFIFLVKKQACSITCVLIGIVIEMLFIFPELIFAYVPPIYYIILANYTNVVMISVILLTLNTLILVRKNEK